MQVIHTSFECFPVAKAGGLADVVGALPKYLQQFDTTSWVIMPHFDVPWVRNHQLEQVHEGFSRLGTKRFKYSIMQEQGGVLGFPIYLVDIPGKLDRPGIYIDPVSDFPYWDEYERFVSFQIAVLDWLKSFSKKPDIIHCHDHHTALIPFLMTGSPAYHEFSKIPTVLTVHNGNYQGWYESEKKLLLPKLHSDREGYLYWNGQINSLSAGLRTAWRITTVSKSYLEELHRSSKGLEPLFSYESGKSIGILNGIDDEIWNPATDPLVAYNYDKDSLSEGKRKNKKWLCKKFHLKAELPLFIFIGRLVNEKGADILADLIVRYLETGLRANFLILGTGDPVIEKNLSELKNRYGDYCDVYLGYNEELAHRMYAGSDFLLMPSRVEPCGLNQMYAMRYGTLPVVRNVGGLRDTVVDYSQPDGYGILFDRFDLDDSYHALQRATSIYSDQQLKNSLQRRAMANDFSWNNAAKQYQKMYDSLIKEVQL